MLSDASNENDRVKNGRGREKMKAVQVVWKTMLSILPQLYTNNRAAVPCECLSVNCMV